MNQIIEGKVFDENENSYFVQYNGMTYQADKDHLNQDISLGQPLRGYIYEDRKGVKRMQAPVPIIFDEGFTWGNITGSLERLGVFVDVGLLNKDIVISLDDLPEDLSQWPRQGDQLYVSMEIDQKGRYWGKIASREELKNIVKLAPPRLKNQDVKVVILDNKGVGYNGITEEGFITFIHQSEVTEPLHLGQKTAARVIDVHPDGRINVSMRPRAHEVIDEDAQTILAVLSRSPKGFLPLHDKSDASEIRDSLGISKKQFKRALGNLLKQGKIEQVIPEGIYLKD